MKVKKLPTTYGTNLGSLGTQIDPSIDVPAGKYFGFHGTTTLRMPLGIFNAGPALEAYVIEKYRQKITADLSDQVDLVYMKVTATHTPDWYIIVGMESYDIDIEMQFKSKGVIPLFVWGVIAVIIAILGILAIIAVADFVGTWHTVNEGARKFFSTDWGMYVSALIIILIILAGVKFAWDYGKSKLKVGRHSTRGRRKVSE
jgi:hypothetical protein